MDAYVTITSKPSSSSSVKKQKVDKEEHVINIPGLQVISDFITRDEEIQLLKVVEKLPWDNSLIRRTQHYGHKYDYTSKSAVSLAPAIPKEFEYILDRLVDKGLVKERPDQLIVNEYFPGQGIFTHIDSTQYFDEGIVSISLGSDVIMDFLNNSNVSDKHDILLNRRSALVIHGDARYKWRHGITGRKSDIINGVKRERSRRVSFTFRKMKPQ